MMAKEITIKLSDRDYQEVQEIAHSRQQEMGDLLTEVIKDSLISRHASGEIPTSAEDAAVVREREAFLALHPTLKSKFLGKFVAIYRGELIDHDGDAASLRARMDAQVPNEFVLIARVGPEPMRTIDVRSPRIARGAMS